MVAVRCAWIVTAGLLPDEPNPDFSRRFEVTNAEWDMESFRARTYADRCGAAHMWASHLEFMAATGYAVNWVRVEFVWY